MRELTFNEVEQVSGARHASYENFLGVVGGSSGFWGGFSAAVGYAARGARWGAPAGAWGAIAGAAIGVGYWGYNYW